VPPFELPLQELAARQQHPLLLSHLRIHMHGLEQANRIIWAIPRAHRCDRFN
jgi:hypothetical protein